ncbi:MAG: hypothetical protein ACAH80_10385 [Alphaproteobacteria bacterium]
MAASKKPAKAPAPATKSARESFAELRDLQDQRKERIRAKLADDMSENLTRISLWLDKMLEDERRLNAQFNGLDTIKLKEEYFGGFALERVSHLRFSPVTFEIGLAYYRKAEVEAMPGFKDLVKACASDAIDMQIIIRTCPERVCQIAEINLEKPFDHNGPYKDMVAKPAVKAAGRKPS